jgi:hypothetical protein
MAHIADFMVDADLPNSVGLNNYIAREVSPAPSHDAVSILRSITAISNPNRYIAVGGFIPRRKGKARLANASTIRITEIAFISIEGKAIHWISRTKKPRYS